MAPSAPTQGRTQRFRRGTLGTQFGDEGRYWHGAGAGHGSHRGPGRRASTAALLGALDRVAVPNLGSLMSWGLRWCTYSMPRILTKEGQKTN